MEEWLQIDLLLDRVVGRVAVRASVDHTAWLTSFKLSSYLSDDRHSPRIFLENAVVGSEEFVGNSNGFNIVEHDVGPVLARGVVIHPLTWQNRIAMQWEIFTCDGNYCFY